ncbi:MAG: T9SS type A sorting domain-containing protein [Flavobacteriales bacterium]|nr:T9SS type A sorting domain-containing protein [Flavobacteriales bacterium]
MIFKSTAFGAILSCCLTFAQAQISIDLLDFGIIGDTIKLNHSNNLNLPMTGSGGANQFWNYSNLQIDLQDTIAIIDPANSPWPGSSQFSNAVLERSNTYSYFDITTSAADFVGLSGDLFGLGTPVEVEFDNAVTQLSFPANYLDSDNDVGGFTLTGTPSDFGLSGLPVQVDSIRVTSQTTVSDQYDGYGDLVLFSDTLNTLRRWHVETRIDSLFMISPILGPGWNLIPPAFLGGFPPPYNTTNPAIIENNKYEWFAKAKDYSVLTIFTTDATGSTGYRATFQYDTTIGPVHIKEYADHKLSIFPNPVVDILNLSFEDDIVGSILVYNSLGGLMLNQRIAGNKMIKVDVSMLPKGAYIIEVPQRKLVSRFVKY